MGKNQNSYIHPEPHKVAHGFVPVFDKRDKELPKSHIFFVENCTWEAGFGLSVRGTLAWLCDFSSVVRASMHLHRSPYNTEYRV